MKLLHIGFKNTNSEVVKLKLYVLNISVLILTVFSSLLSTYRFFLGESKESLILIVPCLFSLLIWYCNSIVKYKYSAVLYLGWLYIVIIGGTSFLEKFIVTAPFVILMATVISSLFFDKKKIRFCIVILGIGSFHYLLLNGLINKRFVIEEYYIFIVCSFLMALMLFLYSKKILILYFNLKQELLDKESELSFKQSQIFALKEGMNLRKDMKKQLLKDLKNKLVMNELSKKDIQQLLVDMSIQKSIDFSIDKSIKGVSDISFMTMLSERYPELSVLELDLCRLIRSGLSTKEISVLQDKKVNTINASKSRIKKKVDTSLDIYVFLLKVN